jgi:hypothetical protein
MAKRAFVEARGMHRLWYDRACARQIPTLKFFQMLVLVDSTITSFAAKRL